MSDASVLYQKKILSAIREQTEVLREQTAAISQLAETNRQLIEALAEDDQDTEVAVYLDGTPVPRPPRAE